MKVVLSWSIDLIFGLTKMGKQSYSVIIDAGKTIGTQGENLI
ncbi:hypothetical protein ABER02_13920 [Rossellomorea marisflavi]